MGALHQHEATAEGGIKGLQAQQRDWSPFVAHFTSSVAMKQLWKSLPKPLEPATVKAGLDQADQKSFQVFQAIVGSGVIRASSAPPTSDADARVCLSECTLPGLISHAERFGRFGIVFRKDELFRHGGRPCVYVSSKAYGKLAAQRGTSPEMRELFNLANVLSPVGFGKVQDFTHEREWRRIGDIILAEMTPVAYIVPSVDYLGKLPSGCTSTIPVIPLTLLHRWGV
jgi:hypothetical protein